MLVVVRRVLFRSLGDAANSLTATGVETITGGTNADVITVDNVAQTITGGGGADTFIFATTFDNAEITDFTSGDDSIHINQSIFADFDALLAATTDDVNSHAVITADPGHTLTLNVNKAALQSGDFHFVV
jgi:serralysin